MTPVVGEIRLKVLIPLNAYIRYSENYKPQLKIPSVLNSPHTLYEYLVNSLP